MEICCFSKHGETGRPALQPNTAALHPYILRMFLNRYTAPLLLKKVLSAWLCFIIAAAFVSERAYADCTGITAAFTPSQTLVCGTGPTSISFSNNSTGTGAAGALYTWYLNGVAFSNTFGLAAPGNSTLSATGTYSYMLVAHDTALNCRDTAVVQVIVRPQPTAAFSFSPDNQCAGTTVSFSNASAGTGGFSTYSWNFGDGGTSTATSPTHAYASGGSYTAVLTMSNGAGCTSTVSHTVTVMPKPVAAISGDDGDGDTQYCLTPVDNTSTDDVTFFNNTTGAVSYSWNFGDGSGIFTTASTANFVHTYSSYGTYTVTMTATGANGCTSTTTLTVVFDKFVSASFSVTLAEFSGCVPHTVTPNNASQNASQYVWNFGDGTPPVTTTSFVAPSHTYTVGGSYTISVIASNSCNSSTSTVGPITVVGPPVINFTATPTPGCSPQSVTFGNTTTGASPTNNYYWDFGNGTTLTGIRFPPAQVYHQGTWTIMMVSGNACGTDTMYRTIVVDTVPTANIAVTPLTGCTPLVVSTTNTSVGGALSYQWYIDGVLSYTSVNIPNQTFTAPAGNTAVNHTIRLRVSNHCGVDDTTVTVTVHPLVTAIMTPASTTVCAGGSVTFTQSSKGDMLTYSWDFGNGNTSSSPTPPAQTYAAAGTYTVTLTVSGFCGTSTATGTVTVNPVPVAPTAAPATICSGTNTTLTATAPGGTYQWYNAPAAGTLLVTSASYTTPVLSATTTYYVQTTVGGCVSPRTPVTVTVNPIPAAPVVAGTTICAGTTATLTPSAPGGTYNWYNAPSAGTLLFTGTPYTTPALASTTTYYVSTTISGCTGPRTAVTVTVTPIPATPTAAGVTVCSGSIATLTATAPGGTYQWYDSTVAGTLLNTGASYTTPALTATHTYYVQTTVSGCTSPRRPVTVTVNPIPVADIVPDITSGCSGLVVHFNNNSTLGGTYSWSFTGGTPATSTLYTPPAVTFSTAGNNPVYLTVTVGGCTMRDTAFISIAPLPAPAFTMIQNTGCSPVMPVITVVSGIGPGDSYVWHLPGGVSSAAPIPSLPPYTATGTDSIYGIELVVSAANGCSDSILHSVTVHANPSAAFTASADTICAGASVAFTNSSAGGSTYQWTFGDGGTSTVASPSHTFATPGNYNPQLIVSTAFSCKDTATALLVVDSVPVAAFTASTECLGFATQFSNVSSGSIVSWNWNFGDGSPAGTTSDPSHLYPSAGTYNVTLTVRNTFGCTGTVTHPVIVNTVPVAAFTGTTACSGQATVFTDQTTGTPISWTWDFGDGTPLSNTHNPSHTYTTAGSYTVTLVAFGGSGCSDTITHTVAVNPVPTADFSFASVCTNDTMFFNSTSFGAPTTFSWSFGDGLSDNADNPAPHHVYTAAGTYNVTLTAGYATGCTSSSAIPVTAYPLTVPGFTATTSCLNVTTAFTDATTGAPSQWNWDFGDAGAGATIQDPSHLYAAPGTYPVKLVTQNAFGCKDSVTISITVNPLPAAAFTFDTVCNGNATAFINQSAASASWSWDFGDGSPISTANSPTHTYAAPGTYPVTLIAATALGCTDTITHSVIVNPNPVAAYTATTACFTYATVFTDQSTSALSWSWNFGDGSPLAGTASPVYTYPAAGNYNAALTVTNSFGCTNTVTQVVAVKPVPVAAFSGTTECLGQATVFSDQTTGSPVSWSWDFGDATAAGTTQNPAHTYTAAGSYNVTLIASGGSGCSDTISNTITVNPVPAAAFSFASVCTNDTMFFSSTSAGTPDTFAWNFGDGFSDNTGNASPQHVYTTAGTYNVTLTAGYGATGCTSSATMPATAYPLTVPSFTSTTPCLNEATVFSDATANSPALWNWNFGDGSAAAVQNPAHTYAAPGTYNVVLVTQNTFGCKDSIAINTVVNPLPAAAFAFDTVCAGTATSFTDQSTAAVTWNWDFGDAATSTGNSPVHTYSASGTYTVTLIVSNLYGCTDTIVHSVIVNPNPVSQFTATTACHTYPTIFTDQSTAAAGWSWNFGDASTADTSRSPAHIFTNPGSYSISLLVTNIFGCTNTSSQTITVLPQPAADFNFNTVCARQSVQFTDATTGAAMTSWNWDFGDGTAQSTMQDPAHTYLLGGNYNVTLIVGNASGCADTVIKPVIVNTVPSPSFTATTSCLGTVTSFSDLSTDTVAISTWFWDFNDGNNSTSQNPDYQYLSTGTYNVSLTVTNINGCDSSVVLPVNVNPVPVAAFTADTVCFGGATVFTDASAGTPSQWSWDFADGSAAGTAQNPVHRYTTAGTYPVTLVVSNTGCADSITKNVLVAPAPVAEFAFDTVCYGALMTFTDQSLSAVTWQWNFNDGSPLSIDNSQTHVFPAPGTYNVTLIVSNINGCSDTVTHTVLVRSNPVAMYTASTACYGYATTFTDNSTGANTWFWNFGDATASGTLQSPSHIFPNPGNYNVWLTVTNTFGCVGTASQIISVLPQPVAGFSFSRACAEQSVQFTDSTSGTAISSWSWDFGDGSGPAATQNPSHTYSASGSYNVTLIAGNASGCTDTIVRQVIVSTVPTPLFSANASCQGTATVFTDLSSDTVPLAGWFYDFGDGNNSTSENPGYIYAAAGTYNVSLTVTNSSGCDTTVMLPVTVNVFPTASYSADTVCIGSVSTFTDHSTGAPTSWQWNFGDGSTDSTGPVTTHTYTTPGSYVTSLTVSSGAACTDQAFLVVVVRNDVHADISAAGSICEDNVLAVNDNSVITSGSIVSDSWDFGDGSAGATTLNTTHLYPVPGTYTITHVVVSDGGCVSTAYDTVVVNPQPTALFTSANTCQSQPGSFTDNSAGTPSAWSWNFGDGGTSSVQNPAHQYTASGTFNTTLIVTTAEGCADTVTRPVIVYAQPDASFSSNVVCWGNSTSFTNTSTTASGTITGYWWDFGDGASSATDNTEHVLQGNSDSFDVTMAIITSFGCVDTVTQVVTTYPLPAFDFGPAQASGCDAFTTAFHDNTTVAGGTIVNWLWNFGDGNLTYTQNPAHTYDSAGSYFVSLTETDTYGCSMTDTLNYPVIAYPHPVAGFTTTPSETSVYDPNIQMNDESAGATLWDWDLGDNETSILQEPYHAYPDTGSYTITQVVINEYGCRDTAQHDIRINGETTVFIPNAFTPNDNGLNDVFAPKISGTKEFTMYIFDRWGNQIFKSTDMNVGWNGRVNNGSGEPVQQDVYVYKIFTKDLLDNDHRYVGKVTVVR